MKLQLLLLAAFFLPLRGSGPELRVYIPDGVRSEDTRISYSVVGPFGGASLTSSYSPQEKAYIVPLVFQQELATHSKGILYMRGCALFSWDVSVKQSDVELRPACEPRPPLRTRGRVKTELRGDVTVFYMAPWSHRFYGIHDGAIMQIQVYSTPLQENGEFNLELPDLFNDPVAHKWQDDKRPWTRGYFWIHLRQRKSGNILGELVPVKAAGDLKEMELLPAYPEMIEFTLQPR